MFGYALKFCPLPRNRPPRFVRVGVTLLAVILIAGAPACLTLSAQQPDPAPVVVQPGAPGQPSRTLPASTRPSLPPLSQADVEFMQGMIMHHSQAVEMTALIPSHTEK